MWCFLCFNSNLYLSQLFCRSVFYDDSKITGQTSILVCWHKGWLRSSCCFHVPSQSALDGWETEWERVGSCASVHVSKNQLLCRQLNAISSERLDKALWGMWRCAWARSLEEKGAADLGKDGAVGTDECGTDSAILMGKYPIVTVMWQSERKRAGEILVCLFNLGWGKHRSRAGLLDGTSRRCPEPVYLPSVCFMAITTEVWHLQAVRTEMKYVAGGLFSRDQRGTCDKWEQQFW